MSNLVQDLQQEITKSDCDVLSALRKAHLIASKLKLTEFNNWIHLELNGYKPDQKDIPEYRQVCSELKTWNPCSNSWIPVIIQDGTLEKKLCHNKLIYPIGMILELYKKNAGPIHLALSANTIELLNRYSNIPIETKYSLHINKHYLKSVIDGVVNHLIEWTIRINENRIVNDEITPKSSESFSNEKLPQQITNYFGNVIYGNINNSNISAKDNNVTYNANETLDAIKEIKKILSEENISDDCMKDATEILNDISTKVNQNKTPGVIGAALAGLKDFLIAAGAGITANFVASKITRLF